MTAARQQPARALATEGSESSVICEGFHDRAFLTGFFLRLGCSAPGSAGIHDPSGKPVRGQGVFGFRTPSGRLLRLVPAQGFDNVRRVLRLRLDAASASDHSLDSVVVCVDGDRAPREGAFDVQRSANGPPVTTFILRAPPAWRGLAAAPLVPEKPSLEQVVLSALASCHPQRARSVAAWLGSRPEPPTSDEHKAALWSHMAGWSAGDGCEPFLRRVWEQPVVERELLALLSALPGYEALARAAD